MSAEDIDVLPVQNAILRELNDALLISAEKTKIESIVVQSRKDYTSSKSERKEEDSKTLINKMAAGYIQPLPNPGSRDHILASDWSANDQVTGHVTDHCDIHPLLSKRSIRLLDDLSDSVEGKNSLTYVIVNILWGILNYNNPAKMKKIKGKVRRERIKIKAPQNANLEAKLLHKNIVKSSLSAKKKKQKSAKDKKKTKSITKESKLKKDISTEPRPGKRKRRDDYKKRIQKREKAIRKRRMRKLERKRQKARRRRSRQSINRKRLIIYHDKDYHKPSDISLKPYPFPDLLTKSYKRKIKIIKIRAPPVSQKIDELIVHEMSSEDELPILKNLTVLPDNVKLDEYEKEGLYKLPDVTGSVFETGSIQDVSKNQTDMPFTMENNYIVMNIVQESSPYPEDDQEEEKRNTKKNQKHVRFSDIVAVLEPNVSKVHQSPMSLSEEEEEDYYDFQSDELSSNTKFDSTKQSTIQRHPETKSCFEVTETYLDGKEWKATDGTGSGDLNPVSILKDSHSTKFISPELVISHAPDTMMRPAWYKGCVSSNKLRNIVKMDFINIIRTHIKLLNYKNYDRKDFIKLLNHQCPIREKEKKIKKKDSNEPKKRGILKNRYRRFETAECRRKYMELCEDRAILNLKGLDELFLLSPGIVPGSDVTVSSYISVQLQEQYDYKILDQRFDDNYFLNALSSSLAGTDISLFERLKEIVEKMVTEYNELRKRLQQEHIEKIKIWGQMKLGHGKESSKEEIETEAEEFEEFYFIDENQQQMIESDAPRKETIETRPHEETSVSNSEIDEKKSIKDNFFERSDDEIFSFHGEADDLIVSDHELNEHLGFLEKSKQDDSKEHHSPTYPYYKTYHFLGFDETDGELSSSDEYFSEEMDETILSIEIISPPQPIEIVQTNASVDQSSVSVPSEVKEMIIHHKQLERINKQKGKVTKKRSQPKITPEQAEMIEVERKKLMDRRKRRLRARLLHRSTWHPLRYYLRTSSDPDCLHTASETVRRPLFDEFGDTLEFYFYPPKVVNSTRRLALELLCKIIHPKMHYNVSALYVIIIQVIDIR
ncbi:repetitive organellar protein-like [Halyomorpha halys]|uniref:repetitive organellar protein-like n=1 Tax=Halyomorpha halys TaxID=286706 RepID=UPI0034D1D26E